MKLGPINQAGSMWSEGVSGDTYYVGDQEFILTADGRVFVRTERSAEPASEDDTRLVLAMRTEDALILRNRAEYAREEAGGNKALERVLIQSACFLDGEPELEPAFKEHPELMVAQVGRNASHYFYLGASEDGRLFKLSMDVFAYYDGEDGALDCREITPEKPAGYMGHD